MVQDEIMKLQTYKMFVGDDTVYVDRDDVLEILKQEPCEDAISKVSVFEILGNLMSIPYVLDRQITEKDVSESMDEIRALPPVAQKSEWNNHAVACLLAELFDDDCACNYNGIDEWLPKKCELLDSCPNPVGVACWEQFLKHRAERGTDE